MSRYDKLSSAVALWIRSGKNTTYERQLFNLLQQTSISNKWFNSHVETVSWWPESLSSCRAAGFVISV